VKAEVSSYEGERELFLAILGAALYVGDPTVDSRHNFLFSTYPRRLLFPRNCLFLTLVCPHSALLNSAQRNL